MLLFVSTILQLSIIIIKFYLKTKESTTEQNVKRKTTKLTDHLTLQVFGSFLTFSKIVQLVAPLNTTISLCSAVRANQY